MQKFIKKIKKNFKRLPKWGKWLICGGGGLIVFYLVLILLIVNPLIRSVAVKQGSKFTGSNVELANVSLCPLRGRLSLDGLVLGNPEGYKTDSALTIGNITVRISLPSLLSKTISVKEILVNDIAITYEVGLGESNFGAILKNLKSHSKKATAVEEAQATAPKEEAVPAEPKNKKDGKKVVIERVCVTGGKVQLSNKLMMGVGVPIPLPTIELRDIGKSKANNAAKADNGEEGASLQDAAQEVINRIANAIISAISSSTDVIGNAGGAIVDGAGSLLDGVIGLFGSEKKGK